MFNFNRAFCILGQASQENEGLAVSNKEGEEQIEEHRPRVVYSKVTNCVLNYSK